MHRLENCPSGFLCKERVGEIRNYCSKLLEYKAHLKSMVGSNKTRIW
jgi:hypothetical protein